MSHSHMGKGIARTVTRRGAIQSLELMLLLPLLAIVLFGVLQLSFLFAAKHRLHSAAQVACRVATLPHPDTAHQEQRMRRAAERVLQHRNLIDNYELIFEPGSHSGDFVTVELSVPMHKATPDLLGMITSVRGQKLVVRTVMRKE